MAVVLGLIVLVPAVVAVVAIGVLGPLRQARETQGQMVQLSRFVASSLTQQCRSLGETTRYLALRASSGTDLQTAAETAARRQPDAFAAVVRGGQVVARAGAVPDVAPDALVAEATSCSLRTGTGTARGDVTGPALVAERTEVTPDAGPRFSVVVGREINQTVLNRLAGTTGRERTPQVALACPGGTGASSADPATSQVLRGLAAAGGGRERVDGWMVSTQPPAPTAGLACAVVAAQQVRTTSTTLLLVLVPLLLVLALGAWLVLRLASSLTRPVLGLTEAAERVARGDLSTRLPSQGRDELARLSGAFNVMTDELQVKIGELERSRDLLRENVSRLGDTLQRTHDLDGLLSTVLQAAMSATDAQRATAWLVEGESIVARVSVPSAAPRSQVRRLSLGSGLAGQVAADGLARRLGHGHGDDTTALGGAALAAPLRRGHGVLGVIVVERETSRPDFGTDDEQMLTSLAGPAGIAVDNVLLHREAQRLSVTDPLTGAGNLRHMTTTLAREVERSTRFDRPLSVLLLDLDHFKNVNDTYGHTVGDAVLRELARRLASVVREVDTVARYGGEEFVVVTPETDTLGAEHLAERICETVREEPFVVGDDVVVVTVSVGVASLPIHGTASGDLVRAADEGLYAAKRAGRDQWQVAPGGEVRVDR
ncbi:GGDEF domain-containing protein [Angustibacter aerolatus]